MTVSTPTTAGQILTSAYVNNNINSGLVYINQASFTASSNAAINDVFSSEYTSYKVIFLATRSTTSGVTMRLRVGVTDDTNATYGNQYAQFNNTTLTAAAANLTAFNFNGGTDAQSLSVTFDIFNPNLAVNTLLSGQSTQGFNAAAATPSMFWGRKGDSLLYTGINFIPSTGTLTGTIQVYGYRIP
jgi:hypothetical protein